MKFLLSSIFLLALLGASYGYSSSWGKRANNDYLLSRQTEVRNPIKNNYWSVNVDFPRAGTVNYYNISAVFVYDNFKNSSGAAPSLWSGGPGFRFATVNLRSQVGKGINSTVEIWGR
ncbi:probable salivary secreted peptide [Drosophila tropicalis]|uniref:probable salivary secreted peptide n=1 Tax=Drosophila tropicalis TaxID=46794 RepID=UPI0035ABAD05